MRDKPLGWWRQHSAMNTAMQVVWRRGAPAPSQREGGRGSKPTREGLEANRREGLEANKREGGARSHDFVYHGAISNSDTDGARRFAFIRSWKGDSVAARPETQAAAARATARAAAEPRLDLQLEPVLELQQTELSRQPVTSG
eukprot:365816-Chlamydomonas_euryale.AAC.6